MRRRDELKPANYSELGEQVANFNEPGVTIGFEQPVVDMEKASVAIRGFIEMDLAKLQMKKANEELLLRVHA